MFCYTDGVTETVNEAGQEFGLQVLKDYFEKNHYKDLKTIRQDIIVDLDGFKGRNGYRDDITMLTCRVDS
jgi:sigma-B regulation protein RsbU (phosphoserine phosphatase)